MRSELKKINGRRIKVYAEVGNFGSKTNWHGFPQQTVCFINIKDALGNNLSDHLWFTVRKTITGLDLAEGDKVCFEARVATYKKGYFRDGKTIDYKLSHPTKFTKMVAKAKTMVLFGNS